MGKILQPDRDQYSSSAIGKWYSRVRKGNCVLVNLLCLLLIATDGYTQTGPAGVGNASTNKVWLRADAGFTQASNSQVASWLDQSGNSFNAVQSTSASRPFYVQNVVNGKPALLFNRSGSTKYLNISGTGLSSVVSNSNTIYVVGAASTGGPDNSTNAYQALVVIPGYHSGIRFGGYEAATSILMTNWFGASYPGTPTNQLVQGMPITQGNWYILSRKIKEISTATTQQSYVNGTMQGDNAVNMQMTNYTNNLIRIGAANISGSEYLWGLNGSIAEVIIFNTALNDAQRILIDNYLSTKYNLAISTDFLQNNDATFVHDVQGIGTTDGAANKHSMASNGKGLHLAELNNSLNSPNEFLLSSHAGIINRYVSEEMPAVGSSRWNRVWYIEKTGQIDAKLSFDISEAGLSPEMDIAHRTNNFKLIFKSAIGEPFEVVKIGDATIVPILENGDRLSFSLSDSELLSGYYTIMISESVATSPVKKLFNGLITSTQWRTDQPYLVSDPGLEGMFVYTYDDKYQIKDARFGEHINHTLNTFNWAGNKFRLTDMNYDANGNILSLKRFDGDAHRQHNFNYAYHSYTNQLKSIEGYTTAYTYNAVGQMTGEDKVQTGEDQYVEYDVSGKVRFVYSDAAKKNRKVEYLYDDRGFRLAKVNYVTQRTTWYIRDASGNVISISEQVGTPTGLFSSIEWGTISNVAVSETGHLTLISNSNTGQAISSTRLKPNQNGYLEYVIEDVMMGKDFGFHIVGLSDLYKYWYQFYGNNQIIAIRRGGMIEGSTGYAVGDVIKIARIGGNVIFYKNDVGWMSFEVDASKQLEIFVNLNEPNAKFSNLKYKITSDPTGQEFVVNQTELPIYGAGKLGTTYPLQDASTNYEITDHLGNVRALLRDNVAMYTATMEDNGLQGETNPRNEENAYFQNIEETVVTDERMNQTATTPYVEPDKAAYLFWNDTQGTLKDEKSVGPAIALRVQAGDVLDIEAWSRFERKDDYTHDFGLVALSALLGNTFVGSGGFEGFTLNNTISNLEGALTAGAFPDDGGEDGVPFAYLNYIIYDEEMVSQRVRWKQVPDEAGFFPNEIGLPEKNPVRVAFDAPITIEQSGYIYIWVSNQSKETRVWFDDLKITHTQNIVVQATDYGVWGDVLQEQKTDESIYRFGYQGQFAEKDNETGWNHFERREYEPIIGRWLNRDQARQFWSPYVGLGNNPVSRLDPDGLWSPPSTEVEDSGDGTYSVVNVKNDKDLNIYVVDKNGNRTGEIIGKTYFWDEFMNHDAMGNVTTPMYGAAIHRGVSIDGWMTFLNDMVKDEVNQNGSIDAGLWLAENSRGGGLFDIKRTLRPTNGYLFKGKYITGRSAGNYLAGYNGYTVKPMLMGPLTFWEALITKAGRLHMEDNHLTAKPHNGKWRGEIDYAGRMISKGYQDNQWGR